MPELTTNQKRLLLKLLLFSVLFIFVSGITGSWVVSTRLLYGFHFFIYGNLGKMVLISLIIFGLLIRTKYSKLEKLPKAKINILYIFLSLVLVPLFFSLGNSLLKYQSPIENIQLFLSTHLILVLIPFTLVLGVFGFEFLVAFLNTFKKETLICLGVSVLYDLAIFQVWKLWPYFSNGVLQSVRFLASLSSSSVRFIQPRVLVVNNFAVGIEESCSGLDSIFLFSTLYLLIAIIDFKQFNKIKLIGMFIPALIGLYIVNIIRVYILVMIGAFISPDLSIKLFHTYLGMVMFIAFFFLFWKMSFRWMKK